MIAMTKITDYLDRGVTPHKSNDGPGHTRGADAPTTFKRYKFFEWAVENYLECRELKHPYQI